VTGKDKHDSMRFGLIAAAVLLGALACAKVAQSVIEPKRVESLAAYAAARNDQDPNRAQPWLDSAKDVAQTLREKNLFVKAPPKKHPVKQVDGILGREVLVEDKWYKAGDTIGDAKVISVESTHVIIEWDGQTKTFAPIASANAKSASAPTRSEAKPKEAKGESPESAAKAEAAAVTVTVTETAGADDPLAWLGVDLPPHVKAKFLELWGSMSEEQKENAKEEWNKMSDDEKQEAIREFEENM
jgi:hypothetical protein